jgi:hypothetical protein
MTIIQVRITPKRVKHLFFDPSQMGPKAAQDAAKASGR